MPDRTPEKRVQPFVDGKPGRCCDYCREPFVPVRRDARFCRPSCRWKAFQIRKARQIGQLFE